jgi:hypothetical protein
MNTQKRWTQPDGTCSSDYDLRCLSNEDITFEIVRRSPPYQLMCMMVQLGDLDPNEAASAVGMYRFKHFEEGRDEGFGRPRFTATTASVYRHKRGKKYRRVPVSRDRIAILVSLEEMSRTGKNEAYLVQEVVAELLKQEVLRFRSNLGPPAPRPEKPKGVYRIHLEACLQVYDLDLPGAATSDILEQVPYIKVLLPSEENGDKEPARKRLRDIRMRNAKLFDELEVANLLTFKG